MDAPLQKVAARYKECCDILGAGCSIQTEPSHDGSAHIEHHEGTYFYVVTERGSEFERRATEDAEEVVYWLVSDLVFGLASRFELSHRVPGQSFRRLLFAKEIEFMARLGPSWAQRKQSEIDAILAEHPFDDRAEG